MLRAQEQARGQVEEEQKVRKLQESDQKPSVERLVLSNQQHMAKVVELPQVLPVAKSNFLVANSMT